MQRTVHEEGKRCSLFWARIYLRLKGYKWKQEVKSGGAVVFSGAIRQQDKREVSDFVAVWINGRLIL